MKPQKSEVDNKISIPLPPSPLKYTSVNPCMHSDEIDFLNSKLMGIESYLEFGSGLSTLYLLEHHSFKNFLSIDSDSEIINNLKNNIQIKTAIQAGILSFIHANIGHTRKWGLPANNNEKILWLNYTLFLWQKIDKQYQVCMIDGRFRLCTSLFALLYLPNAIFFFHDFIHRCIYFPLLKYIEVLDYKNTLIYYSKRSSVSDKDIFDEIGKCIFDPR